MFQHYALSSYALTCALLKFTTSWRRSALRSEVSWRLRHESVAAHLRLRISATTLGAPMRSGLDLRYRVVDALTRTRHHTLMRWGWDRMEHAQQRATYSRFSTMRARCTFQRTWVPLCTSFISPDHVLSTSMQLARQT